MVRTQLTTSSRTGATTKELMARLGHASPRASMIHQHAADDRDRRIAEGLDAMAGMDPARLGVVAFERQPHNLAHPWEAYAAPATAFRHGRGPGAG